MKMKSSMWFMLLVFGVLFCIISAIDLHADDVYNFYFQKAPGPTTVNQSGGAPSSSSAPIVQQSGGSTPQAAGSPAPTSATGPSGEAGQSTAKVEAKKEEPNDFHHWEIFGGLTNFNYEGQGVNSDLSINGPINGVGQWMLGGQYNFNKYLGVQLELMQVQGKAIKLNGNSTIDVAADIVLTPFHIDFFGYDLLDIGVVAGGGTLPDIGFAYSNLDVVHSNSWFIGPKIDLNLSKQFALSFIAKTHTDVHVVQTSFDLSFKL